MHVAQAILLDSLCVVHGFILSLLSSHTAYCYTIYLGVHVTQTLVSARGSRHGHQCKSLACHMLPALYTMQSWEDTCKDTMPGCIGVIIA